MFFDLALATASIAYLLDLEPRRSQRAALGMRDRALVAVEIKLKCIAIALASLRSP
jgi:hypothetical protein